MAKTILTKPGLDCRLFNDDITKVKANAVVVSESPCLDIYSRETQTLMDKVRLFKPMRMGFKILHSRLDFWSVDHSYLRDTFDFVIHAVINMDQNGTWVENMTKLYHRIFRKAEDLRAFTIALPLLATGKVSADHSLAIKALVSSVLSYSPREHLSIIVVSKEQKTLHEAEAQFRHALVCENRRESLLRGGFRVPYAIRNTMFPTRKRAYVVEDRGKSDCYTGLEKRLKNYMEASWTLHKQPTQQENLGAVKVYGPNPRTSLAPDRFLTSEQQKQLRYVKDLKELKEVAKKKGFTLRKAWRETDIFNTLSEQVTSVLREKIEEGHLRTVVADYLRRCQSNNDKSLEDFLIGTTLADVLFSVERGEDVDSHVIISAVCNVMNVEVLLLASSRGEIQEVLFRPFREKEFLPRFVLGNISTHRFISLENVQAQVPSDIPYTWSRTSKDTELVTLRPESAEFKEVKRSFFSSIGCSLHSVGQIKRVQSTTQWKHFNISRGEMAKKYPGMTSERRLWHGTAAESINHICKEGFNRSFCGKNATIYGKGTYFSKVSSYAALDKYSVPGRDGFKYMFRARVLTGMYTKGDSSMKVPPWFDEENRVRCDSVVDDVVNPTMFVIFHDAKAYPEYLIKFT